MVNSIRVYVPEDGMVLVEMGTLTNIPEYDTALKRRVWVANHFLGKEYRVYARNPHANIRYWMDDPSEEGNTFLVNRIEDIPLKVERILAGRRRRADVDQMLSEPRYDSHLKNSRNFF